VVKEVLVDRIVERNVETIKQVHAGLERVVPIYVERIKEVRFLLRMCTVQRACIRKLR